MDNLEDVKRNVNEYAGKVETKGKSILQNIAYEFQWTKLIPSWTKTLVLILIVLGIVYGVAYWNGHKTLPFTPQGKDFHATVRETDRDREFHDIIVKNGILSFDGVNVINGQIEGMKPFGVSFQPELIACYGKYGKSIGFGAEVLYFYDLGLDIYGATDKSANIGISYDLKAFSKLLQNSSLGISYGKVIGSGETDYKVYFKLKF